MIVIYRDVSVFICVFESYFSKQMVSLRQWELYHGGVAVVVVPQESIPGPFQVCYGLLPAWMILPVLAVAKGIVDVITYITK